MIHSVRSLSLLLLLAMASLMPIYGLAQDNNVKASPRAANALYSEKNHHDALMSYLKLVVENPDNTFYHYRVGMCHYYLGSYAEAISYLKKSVDNFDSFLNSSPVDAFYYLARCFHLIHKFHNAITSYTKYRSYVEFDLQFEIQSLKKYYTDNGTSELAQQMKLIYEDRVIKELLEILFLLDDEINRCNYGKVLVRVPVDVVIENLGPDVNTKYSEYAPVISSDETQLAYTSRAPTTTGGELSPDGDYYEDIYLVDVEEGRVNEGDLYNQKNQIGYYSILKELKTSKPINIGLKINTSRHEGAVQFSGDDSKMFIYRDFKLWASELKDDKWNNAVQLKGFDKVFDKIAFEPSLTLSIDENVLFFSSNREGGYGGLDLYVTTKKRNGEWNEPHNMGPVVNTRYDEDAPYIDPNGRTLYFSSKGHSSIGGYDVFKSELHKRKWRSPVNIGYPVNSAGDDIFFMMTPKFNRAYYSTNKNGGYGKMDIYRLTFAEERSLFAEIKGLVLSGNKQIPSFSKISVLDKITGEELSVHYSDSTTGEYLLLLPHGITYDIRVETEGFVPYQEEYRIPTQISYFQFFQEIKHFHITDKNGNVIGQKVVLENAYYEVDDYIEEDSVAVGQKETSELVEELELNYTKLISDSSNTYDLDKKQLKFFVSEDSLNTILDNDSTVYDQIRDVIAYGDSLERMSSHRDDSYSEFVSSLMHANNELEFSKMADIKFYISQDSLVKILKEDTTVYAQIKEIIVSPEILDDEVERPYHKFIVGMIAEDLTTMKHIEKLSEQIGVPVDSLVKDMQKEQMLDADALSQFSVKFFKQDVNVEELDNEAAYDEPEILVVNPTPIEEAIVLQGNGEEVFLEPIDNTIKGQFNYARLSEEVTGKVMVYLVSEEGDTITSSMPNTQGMFEFTKLPTGINYRVYSNIELLTGEDASMLISPMDSSIKGRFDFARLPKQYAEGATIYLISELGDTVLISHVNASGIFEFTQLPSDVKYSIVLNKSGINPNIKSRTISAATVQTGAKLIGNEDLAARVNETLIEAKKIESDIENLIKAHKDKGDVFIVLPSLVDKHKKKEEGEIRYGEVVATFYFDFDHHKMKSVNCVYIEDFYSSIKDKKYFKYKVVGHTDSEGAAEYNLQLSEDRARWVSKYLNSLGLEWFDLNTQWKGEKELAFIDRNSLGKLLIEEMHKNRRVEVIAIKK
ncbi:MAG: PD40 domain-containing protein [Flavobacteriales bacterium]|nr:PD40 domain-containing protein [Flavobacteriales bacterium]